MEDLRRRMILKGTVRNVVDFGAFVDIAVEQDGLVHISELATTFFKSSFDGVSVGDGVDVKALAVDIPKRHAKLSIKP